MIAVADPAPTGLRWRGTRPIPDGLVGRDDELVELEELLRQNRLVTLVGPGGVGKTELALAAADRFSGRDTTVVVVDLTTVQRDAAVPSAILDAFGTAPGTSDLDDVLSGRKPGDLVIVEDNAEHVLDGVATVANRMVRSFPGHRRTGHVADPARAAGRGGAPGAGARRTVATTRISTEIAASRRPSRCSVGGLRGSGLTSR